MSNELVRKNLETGLALGSLEELVRANEVVMWLIDTSGSMSGWPIEQLRKVVSTVNEVDRVPMIAFGGPYDAQVRFVDVIPEPDGGTPLHDAIKLAKSYGATRLVVISDGVPDLRDESMLQARQFGGRIDVAYIGPAGGPGEAFLDQLAAATGGKRITGNLNDTKLLANTVIGLLAGGVEERAPLQGPGFTSEASSLDSEEDVDDESDTDDDDEDDDEDDDQ